MNKLNVPKCVPFHPALVLEKKNPLPLFPTLSFDLLIYDSMDTENANKNRLGEWYETQGMVSLRKWFVGKEVRGAFGELAKIQGHISPRGWRLRPSYCKAVPILAASPEDLGRYILGGETLSLRITHLQSVPPIIRNHILMHFSHLGFVTPCTWRPRCYPHLIAGETEDKGAETDLLSPRAGRQWTLNVDL